MIGALDLKRETDAEAALIASAGGLGAAVPPPRARRGRRRKDEAPAYGSAGAGGGPGGGAGGDAGGGGKLRWDARRRKEVEILRLRADAIAAECARHAARNCALRVREVVLTSLDVFLRARVAAICEENDGAQSRQQQQVLQQQQGQQQQQGEQQQAAGSAEQQQQQQHQQQHAQHQQHPEGAADIAGLGGGGRQRTPPPPAPREDPRTPAGSPPPPPLPQLSGGDGDGDGGGGAGAGGHQTRASCLAAAAAAAGIAGLSLPPPALPGQATAAAAAARGAPHPAAAADPAAAAAAASVGDGGATPLLQLVWRGPGGLPRRAEAERITFPIFCGMVRRLAENSALVLRKLAEAEEPAAAGEAAAAEDAAAARGPEGAPPPPRQCWGAITRAEAERRLAADVTRVVRADFLLSLHFPERMWRVKTTNLETLAPIWHQGGPRGGLRSRGPQEPGAAAGGAGAGAEEEGGDEARGEGSGGGGGGGGGPQSVVDCAHTWRRPEQLQEPWQQQASPSQGEDGDDAAAVEDGEDDAAALAALDASARDVERYLQRPAGQVLRTLPSVQNSAILTAVGVALPRLNATLRGLREVRAGANAALGAALVAGDRAGALAALARIEALQRAFSNAQWEFGHGAAANQGVLDAAHVFVATWPLYPSVAAMSEVLVQHDAAGRRRVVGGGGGGGGGGSGGNGSAGGDAAGPLALTST